MLWCDASVNLIYIYTYIKPTYATLSRTTIHIYRKDQKIEVDDVIIPLCLYIYIYIYKAYLRYIVTYYDTYIYIHRKDQKIEADDVIIPLCQYIYIYIHI